MKKPGQKSANLTVKTLLVLHAFTALNAIWGGYYGISGAEKVPESWLRGTPFNTYLLPGLFLLIVIGGSCTLSFVLLYRMKRMAASISLITGIILGSWIMIQVRMIGFESFLQLLMFSIALLIVILSYRLRGGSVN